MPFPNPKSLAGLLCGCFFLACAPSSPAADAPKKSALDKPTLEAYVRHLAVWGPQIAVKIDDPKPSEVPGFMELTVHATAGTATRDEVFYVSKDGQHILRGQVYNVANNPFQSELRKLKTDSLPGTGTPGAPVVLVLFSDFECGFCKEESKMLRQNLLSAYPKQVRLYYADFPLEQIHPWAKMAAIAGRCIFRLKPDAFWDYHDFMFEHQADITADNLKTKVLDFAKEKQIDTLQLSRCLETRATEADVEKTIAQAKSLDVNSTPTLFVNGRRLAGQMGWPDLRSIIDYEIDYQKTAKNAGEDCGCEMKLPSPVGN